MAQYTNFAPNPLMGDPVRIAFVGTPSSTSSSTVGLYMPDGELRTLKSTERLVIDNLIADVASGSVDLLNAGDGTGTTYGSTLLASFSSTTVEYHSDKEGLPVRVGVTPSLLSSNGTGSVKLSGEGRVMEGTTQGVRPPWREATVRGD